MKTLSPGAFSDNGPLSLDLLFDELPPGTFINDFFPHSLVVSHSPSALARLSALPVTVATIPQILRDAAALKMKVWIEGNSYDADATEAIDALNNGGAVYLYNVERTYPDLQWHISAICQELGVPTNSGSCSLFITLSETLIPLHFDADFGFNILLKGNKRWRTAVNESVHWPTSGYDCINEPSSELLSYAGDRLRDQRPTAFNEFTTRSGSVCFLPRGLWHSTTALTDCVALDFAIDPPVWADYVSKLIRLRLLKYCYARESVVGVSSASALHGSFVKKRLLVEQLLTQLDPHCADWLVNGTSEKVAAAGSADRESH